MSAMRFLIFAAVSSWCWLASVASAEVIVNVNFNGDTIGQPPATNLSPGNVVTQPYAIGGFGPPGTILVGNIPGMSKGAILISNPANGDLGAQYLDVTGFSLPGQQLAMSFDVNILSAPTTATSQPMKLGPGTAGILLGMNVHTSNGWAFRFAAAPTSADGGVFAFRTPANDELIPFFNYEEGKTYHIDILADYSTGTLDAFVDGVQLLTGFAFWNSGAANISTNEFFFHLNGESGHANVVAIDNLFAIDPTTVPEPASLLVWSLLGVATVGAVRHTRRKLSTAA
jgi:hypothetical protein